MIITDVSASDAQCSADCPYWFRHVAYCRPDSSYGHGVIMASGPSGGPIESDRNWADDDVVPAIIEALR